MLLKKLLSLSFFLLLLPFFSIAADSTKVISIEHDSITNPRFQSIANLFFDHLKAGDIKAYKDDLTTLASQADINDHLVQEVSRYDDGGNEIMVLTHFDETNVNEYELRQKGSDYFISPYIESTSRVWIKLDDLKGVLDDASVKYMRDLFENDHTEVNCKMLTPGDMNEEFDNNMQRIFFRLRNLVQMGELKAYADDAFVSELSQAMLIPRLQHPEMSFISEDPSMDPSPVSRLTLPSHFYYLFGGEWNKGILKVDSSNIIGLAPVSVCIDSFTGQINEACHRPMFWVKYTELERLLLGFEKEIIAANLNKQYTDYIVQRFSNHFYSLYGQADSLALCKLRLKILQEALNRNLNAYKDPELNEQMTISEIKERIFDVGYLDQMGAGLTDDLEKVAPRFDWFCLTNYHYRLDDHEFNNGSLPLSVAPAYESDAIGHQVFYTYLPELRGRLSKDEYELLMGFFEKNKVVKKGEFLVDKYGYLTLDTNRDGKPLNLPDSYNVEGKKLKVEYEPEFVTKKEVYTTSGIYINRIVEHDPAPLPPGPDKYYSAHPLIPYNDVFGKNTTSPMPMVLLPYKAGYCDENGVVRIPLHYDYVEFFSEARGLVGNRMNENGNFVMRFGFVDHKGYEVIPMIYEDARSFSNGWAAVKQKGKWGYVSKYALTSLPFLYDRAYSFSEGRAVVMKDPEKNGTGKKFGVINLKGKVVCDFLYDSICTFHDGIACVMQNGKWGYIDSKGKVKVPFKYIKVMDAEGGILKCVTDDGLRDFYSYKGKPLYADKGRVYTASGNVLVVLKDNKLVLTDIKGSEIKTLDCNSVTNFSEGIMPVNRQETWNVIDLKGNLLIPLNFSRRIEWTTVFKDSVCLAKGYTGEGHNCWIMDCKGRIISDNFCLDLTSTVYLDNGYFNVKRYYMGYINRSGKEYFYH